MPAITTESLSSGADVNLPSRVPYSIWTQHRARKVTSELSARWQRGTSTSGAAGRRSRASTLQLGGRGGRRSGRRRQKTAQEPAARLTDGARV